MAKENAHESFGHKGCTVICADTGRAWPRTAPKFIRERTHGCWCSSWRLTRNGLRVWRQGRWQKPRPREVQRRREVLT